MSTLSNRCPPGKWMLSVATALDHVRNPFTYGEAVQEVRLWAAESRESSWKNQRNRESLALDLSFNFARPGPRVRAAISQLHIGLDLSATRESIVSIAETFLPEWRSPKFVRKAFYDLCEAASSGCHPSWRIAPLAEILVSMMGEGASSDFGAIRDITELLNKTASTASLRSRFSEFTSPGEIADSRWLELAEEAVLRGTKKAEVVVWLQYRRARMSWRLPIGPVTFFEASWAIPEAKERRSDHFPEREEILTIIEHADSLGDDDPDMQKLIVLARINLGWRAVSGAAESAREQVEALLNIMVGEGGASWEYTGATATLADGRVGLVSSTHQYSDIRHPLSDLAGTNLAATILEDWGAELDPVMQSRPMPRFLVEALSTFRDSTMTTHRDVTWSGERAVSERIATALEDHVLELVGSLASMEPESVSKELHTLASHDWYSQRIAAAIMSPTQRRSEMASFEPQQELARNITRLERGANRRVVDLEKAVGHEAELCSFARDPAEVCSLALACKSVHDPKVKAALVEELNTEMRVLAKRHRRVRNAVTHGNPVTPTALTGVRRYSRYLSRQAVRIALDSYVSGKPIAQILHKDSGTSAI